MDEKQFGEWIKQLRAASISRENFAKKYDRHRNTIKNYENEGRLPDLDHLFFLAVETGYNFHELVKQRLLVAQKIKKLPVNIDVKRVCEARAQYTTDAETDDLNQLKVGNDMMSPTAQEGALVAYDPANSELQDGRMYIVQQNDTPELRRIRLMPDGSAVLVCDNPAFPPQKLDQAQLANLTVMGAVKSVTHYY